MTFAEYRYKKLYKTDNQYILVTENSYKKVASKFPTS